ncbi:MAG TPA: hypothetical protein VGX76_19575, partial [Pirellulales bacterium]|nr:hypothetical protein [Pirellulales bacterium]
TDGVAFVKEFGRQLGANLAKIFDNLAPAFKNLGVLIEAVFTLAIKKAVRAAMPDKLARWFGIDQADANEKAIETAIPFLGQMLGNSLKQAFDNLPGFDLAGVFGAGQSQEVIDALKKLNAAKLGFDKADAMQPAIDAFFEAKRRAETLFAEEPGGGGPGKVAAGGGKGFRAEFLDPVAFYKKLQGGVNSNAEKARDNRQVAMAKDLHDVAEHFRRQPNKVGRPMPAVLA